jgi:hypothetical protein
MANEISVTVGASVTNGYLRQTTQTQTRQFTQTTARAGSVCQDVGTSEETVAFGDVVPGYVVATNLDTTNFVSLRFASGGGNAIRLPANGGQACFHLGTGITLYAIADTAACKVKFDSYNT